MIIKYSFLLLLLYNANYAFIPEIISQPRIGYPAFSYLSSQESQFKKYSPATLLPMATANIGIYGNPYLFPTIYAGIIELLPSIFVGKLPQTLKMDLRKHLGISYEKFIQAPMNHTYAFIIVVPLLKQNNTLAAVYNVVYHFFYELATGQHQFIANLLMGLFEPKGISSVGGTSIPLNRFGSMQVHTHPGEEYRVSPNNAQFKVNTNQAISTCWLSAIAPDKKQLSITYLILLRDTDLVVEIARQGRGIKKISEYLLLLGNMANFYTDNDRVQFLAAIDTIENILKQDPKDQIEGLRFSLIKLKQQLTELNKSLQTIQK